MIPFLPGLLAPWCLVDQASIVCFRLVGLILFVPVIRSGPELAFNFWSIRREIHYKGNQTDPFGGRHS